MQYGASGWEHIPAAEACRALIVFNHVSYVDGVALVSIFLPSGLANTSVAQMPFVGALTKVPCPASALASSRLSDTSLSSKYKRT